MRRSVFLPLLFTLQAWAVPLAQSGPEGEGHGWGNIEDPTTNCSGRPPADSEKAPNFDSGADAASTTSYTTTTVTPTTPPATGGPDQSPSGNPHPQPTDTTPTPSNSTDPSNSSYVDLCTTPGATLPPYPQPSTDSYSDWLVWLHNMHRRNHSVPDIAWNDTLAQSAQDVVNIVPDCTAGDIG